MSQLWRAEALHGKEQPGDEAADRRDGRRPAQVGRHRRPKIATLIADARDGPRAGHGK
jgi:hypothetical protein